MTAVIDLQKAFGALAQTVDCEVEVASCVAQLIDHETDERAIIARLDELVVGLKHAAVDSVEALLASLLKHGLGTATLRQAQLRHSHIGWVLAHHEGLPITLAVVLIQCARRLNLTSHGINFPGHFLVQIEQQYIDPLGMTVVDPAQLLGRNITVNQLSRMMQPASAQALGLRMLNNVKAVLAARQDWPAALDVVDCQLALAGADPTEVISSLQFEKGELWERIGAHKMARQAYEACLRSSVDAALTQRAQARIEALAGRQDTLH